MRHRIAFEFSRVFEPPARVPLLLLRLTPRPHDGQHIPRWRIDVEADAILRADEDACGNQVHALQLPGPAERLELRVEGTVETFDTAGIVRGAVERLPPPFFLRDTRLTAPEPSLRSLAARARGAGSGTELSFAHELSAIVSDEMRVPDDPDAAREAVPTERRTAAAAHAARAGDAADLAHILVAAARAGGAPARVARGFVAPAGDAPGLVPHWWAELHVEGYGWIGFDPSARLCPTERYVRVACGFDAEEIAAIRGPGRALPGRDLSGGAARAQAQSQNQGAAQRHDAFGRSGGAWGQGQSQGGGSQRQSQGGPTPGADAPGDGPDDGAR